MTALTSTHPLARRHQAQASEVSLLRLYTIRVVFALMAFALGSDIWPVIVNHTKPWTLMQGVGICMLGAVSATALLGLRYPLKMLPLFFFEIVWKTTWLIVVALPAWQAGQLGPIMETTQACLMGVIFLIAMPWGYVFKHYVKASGDRWI